MFHVCSKHVCIPFPSSQFTWRLSSSFLFLTLLMIQVMPKQTSCKRQERTFRKYKYKSEKHKPCKEKAYEANSTLTTPWTKMQGDRKEWEVFQGNRTLFWANVILVQHLERREGKQAIICVSGIIMIRNQLFPHVYPFSLSTHPFILLFVMIRLFLFSSSCWSKVDATLVSFRIMSLHRTLLFIFSLSLSCLSFHTLHTLFSSFREDRNQ